MPSVNPLRAPRLSDDAIARFTAIQGVAALIRGDARRVVALAPPEEQPRLRQRLDDRETRRWLFEPAGWRAEFLRTWDGDTHDLTRATPSTALVTLGHRRGHIVRARLRRGRAGAWHFQGVERVDSP